MRARALLLARGAVAALVLTSCTRVPEPLADPPRASATLPPASAAPVASPSTSTRPAIAPSITVPRVIARTPHDRGAFTQGLVYAGGAFLESTGRYGESTLRRVEIATGHVQKRVDLPASVFAEGLARLGGELFQLTWREHVCYVYDEATFAKRRELHYDGEGWGITTDGAQLVMSDGSSSLRFLDPQTFRAARTIEVHDARGPVLHLNELEWVKGEILANVWLTRTIVRVDPSSGAVLGTLDLTSLPEPRDDEDAVLNGIAYDATSDRLWVTGKLWGSIYEIARTW